MPLQGKASKLLGTLDSDALYDRAPSNRKWASPPPELPRLAAPVSPMLGVPFAYTDDPRRISTFEDDDDEGARSGLALRRARKPSSSTARQQEIHHARSYDSRMRQEKAAWKGDNVPPPLPPLQGPAKVIRTATVPAHSDARLVSRPTSRIDGVMPHENTADISVGCESGFGNDDAVLASRPDRRGALTPAYATHLEPSFSPQTERRFKRSLHASAEDSLPFHAAMPSSSPVFSPRTSSHSRENQTYSSDPLPRGQPSPPHHPSAPSAAHRHTGSRELQHFLTSDEYAPSPRMSSRPLHHSNASIMSKQTVSPISLGEMMAEYPGEPAPNNVRLSQPLFLKPFPIVRTQVSHESLLDEVLVKQDNGPKRGLMRKRDSALRSTVLRTNARQMQSNLSSKLASLTGAQTIGQAQFSFDEVRSSDAFAVLHCFKTASESAKEEERLTLTSGSYAAVAESVPTINGSYGTWGLKVSGLATSHNVPKSRAAEQQHVEWLLLFDTKARMMHWQATLRALVTALTDADQVFRSGIPTKSSDGSGERSVSPVTPKSPEWAVRSSPNSKRHVIQRHVGLQSDVLSDTESEDEVSYFKDEASSSSHIYSRSSALSLASEARSVSTSELRRKQSGGRSARKTESFSSQASETVQKKDRDATAENATEYGDALGSPTQLVRSKRAEVKSELPSAKTRWSSTQRSLPPHANPGHMTWHVPMHRPSGPPQGPAPRQALPAAPTRRAPLVPTASRDSQHHHQELRLRKAVSSASLLESSARSTLAPDEEQGAASMTDSEDGPFVRRSVTLRPSRTPTIKHEARPPASPPQPSYNEADALAACIDASYNISPYTSFFDAGSSESDAESLIDCLDAVVLSTYSAKPGKRVSSMPRKTEKDEQHLSTVASRAKLEEQAKRVQLEAKSSLLSEEEDENVKESQQRSPQKRSVGLFPLRSVEVLHQKAAPQGNTLVL